MPKKLVFSFLIIFTFIFCHSAAFASDDLAKKLSGRILLQTENKGEAWYVNPLDQKRYYLSRPEDAYALMRKFGIGIKNTDLEKIPTANSNNQGDKQFTQKNLGRIFLQTENKGEAWYLDPLSKKRYYLLRPANAFWIMQKFGLGISNLNLEKIQIGNLDTNQAQSDRDESVRTGRNESVGTGRDLSLQTDPISGAASAIRANDKNAAASYFIPEMKKAIEYTMDFLDADGRLTLGNILSGSTLSSETDTKKTYTNEVYFSLGGYKVPLKFFVEKQADGTWLLTNL